LDPAAQAADGEVHDFGDEVENEVATMISTRVCG
jgi:hypothetical protein